MKNTSIGIFLLAFAVSFGFAPKEKPKIRQICYLAVPFVKDAVVRVKFQNHGDKAVAIAIQPWQADGSPSQRVLAIIPAAATNEIAVDVSAAIPTYGWIEIEEHGDSVETSAIYEYTEGNSLSTISMHAVFRHPTSEAAVKSAKQHSIHHRYTYDVFALRGSFYVFVNLSDYPVRAGLCQASHPNCVVRSLPHVVNPRASLVLPISQEKQFMVLHSSPGHSAATAVEWADGFKQVFTAASSITFESRK